MSRGVRVTLVLVSIALATAPAAAARVEVRSTTANGVSITTGPTATDDRLEAYKAFSQISGDRYEIHDLDGDEVVAREGCSSIRRDLARCEILGPPILTADLGAGNDRLILNTAGDCFCSLGDGDDTLRVLAGGSTADLVNGGNGNDTIETSLGDDVVNGGNGNDTLDAGAGNDTVSGGGGDDTLSGGMGDDTIFGGDGADFSDAGATPDGADEIVLGRGPGDVISYASRTFPLNLSIDGQRNDGAQAGRTTPPENDAIGASSGGKLTLRAGRGSDIVLGGPNPERLEGGPGNDVVRGGSSTDRVGVDDTIDGGPGIDTVDGQGGNDELLMRDAEDDQASAPFACGLGFDTLVPDLRDDDTRALTGRGCEVIDAGEVTEHPNVIVRSRRAVVRGGQARIRMSCPRRTRRGCKGTLAAGRDGSRPNFGRATKYSIRAGRSATVSVAVAHRQSQVVLRSIERGRRGRPRTTFVTLPRR